MKIRQLSKVALAVALSSAIFLEGCKKYDDDIAQLKGDIEKNASAIGDLKSQLTTFASTKIVVSVTPISGDPGGQRITFKDLNGETSSIDIPNGKNGTNGVTPNIRINDATGEWEIDKGDGEGFKSTGIKAKGQ